MEQRDLADLNVTTPSVVRTNDIAVLFTSAKVGLELGLQAKSLLTCDWLCNPLHFNIHFLNTHKKQTSILFF